MPFRLDRYETNDIIVQHLASHYVCGLLPQRVHNRVKQLLLDRPQGSLDRAIHYWEAQLAPLDTLTPEVQPDANIWSNIEDSLGLAAPKATLASRLFKWFTQPSVLVAQTAFALFAVVTSITVVLNQPANEDLSYIAVLSNDQVPQLIAATYGESKQLKLDILALPEPSDDEDYELWVVSKTDRIARSLGIVDVSVENQSRQLSEAQWRLIKDSHSLLITREEAGGSPFGEPLGEVVSQGLCIQMPGWQNEV